MSLLTNDSFLDFILHKYSTVSLNIKEYNYWDGIFLNKNFKHKRLKF